MRSSHINREPVLYELPVPFVSLSLGIHFKFQVLTFLIVCLYCSLNYFLHNSYEKWPQFGGVPVARKCEANFKTKRLGLEEKLQQ